MKLNEAYFKPLFLKVLNWATLDSTMVELSPEFKLKRQVTFYRVLDQLLDKLKVKF